MIRVLLPDEMDDHHEARENLRSLYHGLPTSIHGQVCRNLLGSGRGGKSYFAPPTTTRRDTNGFHILGRFSIFYQYHTLSTVNYLSVFP